MPGVPIEMPSDTVMVLNSTLLPPAASTPAHVSRASSPMCMLQGVTLPQVDATPICGLAKSASPKPVARSIARDGACLAPSTTTREWARGSTVFFTPSSSFDGARARPCTRGACQLSLHAIETERTRGRHQHRQQQRVFARPGPQALEPGVREHAERRCDATPEPRERD